MLILQILVFFCARLDTLLINVHISVFYENDPTSGNISFANASSGNGKNIFSYYVSELRELHATAPDLSQFTYFAKLRRPAYGLQCKRARTVGAANLNSFGQITR